MAGLAMWLRRVCLYGCLRWLNAIQSVRLPVVQTGLIAPADGVIADIEEVDAPRYIEGRALRIGIFLGVFDVHEP